jgi:predicted ATPase
VNLRSPRRTRSRRALIARYIACGKYALANSNLDELATLADEKGALFWKALGQVYRGCIMALTSQSSEAARLINSGIAGYRSTGATVYAPLHLSILANAFIELGRYDDALRSIDEALTLIETSKERWWQAEVNRAAGELTVKLPGPDPQKAERYFDRALEVARAQEAKSWELRATMSVARLWRDQGKRDEARDLLAPVYCWFTEGFDTRDLKEAKGLLDELAT